MTRKSSQKRAARARQQRLGGKYLHHRAAGEAAAALAWYWRRELGGAGWTVAACGEHGKRLEGDFRFVGVGMEHPVDGYRLDAPPSCPLCAGTLAVEDLAACRCEVTLACPVHPNEQLEELAVRMSMIRGRDYPWDHWVARARVDGVGEELAGLGRSLVREFFQHGWSPKLGPFCGYGDPAGARMIAFAKDVPEIAGERWQWLLDTDGLRGEWRNGNWRPWSEAEAQRALIQLGEP